MNVEYNIRLLMILIAPLYLCLNDKYPICDVFSYFLYAPMCN